MYHEELFNNLLVGDDEVRSLDNHVFLGITTKYYIVAV